ncbi:MAG: hypothetical protein C5B53_05880 [Candidatus Melainabacteria bacterium]|nr:MAG: hypothetical protein C5B53_05880 [Candidatus Melainabacteria bacterium]
MPKAMWNGAVLAESRNCQSVEGNCYFPPEALAKEYFVDSPTTSVCPWKGTARYYDLNVNGAVNKDAAWYYPETKEAANKIRGYVAFWKGVVVENE